MRRTKQLNLSFAIVLFVAIIAWWIPSSAQEGASANAQEINRLQLPIPDVQYKYPGKVPLDARDAKFPPIKELRPPKGAPNVVVILLDDIGFGAPSTFGGGINMPTLDIG
jgi:hypothetical protein